MLSDLHCRAVMNANTSRDQSALVIVSCPWAAVGMSEAIPANYFRAEFVMRHGVGRGVERDRI